MQSKNTVRYHFIFSRAANIKSDDPKNRAVGTPSIAGGTINYFKKL